MCWTRSSTSAPERPAGPGRWTWSNFTWWTRSTSDGPLPDKPAWNAPIRSFWCFLPPKLPWNAPIRAFWCLLAGTAAAQRPGAAASGRPRRSAPPPESSTTGGYNRAGSGELNPKGSPPRRVVAGVVRDEVGWRLLGAILRVPSVKRRWVPSKTAVFGCTLGKIHEGSTTFQALSPMTCHKTGPRRGRSLLK